MYVAGGLSALGTEPGPHVAGTLLCLDYGPGLELSAAVVLVGGVPAQRLFRCLAA